MIDIEEAVANGLDDTIKRARDIVGDDETYVTFDIDCLDPAFAPGTGTPEAGGFTTREAQAMLRGNSAASILWARTWLRYRRRSMRQATPHLPALP